MNWKLAFRCLLPAALCSLAAAAPTALRWTVEGSRPAPADWTIFQGETVLLEPAFASYGDTLPLTNCTAALYWQTNGMDAAWWTVPAEIVTAATPRVRATWAPTNDCGAARYSYFISLSASGGLSYRAYGRLTMRPSPGATPSILAAPTTLTDALAAWGDGRYEIAGTAQATSNALAGALLAEAAARLAGDAVSLTNWQAVAWSLTNGAALGATALQPAFASTGTTARAIQADTVTGVQSGQVVTAAAHAATAHGLSVDGGFFGGLGASSVFGAAAGHNAYTDGGGSVGSGANSIGGGAVGDGAYTTGGGAVGTGAKTSDGFAGGLGAYATDTGAYDGTPIDAIQLGTGGNSEPFSLQIYSHKLMHADGTIPVERMAIHNTNGGAHADIRAQVAAIPTNVVGGWLVYDEGSNCYWRVTATNLRFYVWGNE